MSLDWYLGIVGIILVLGFYLAGAYLRIVQLEKRVEELDGKKGK